MMYPQEKHEYDVLQTERSVAWVVLATLVLTIAGLCWVVWSIYADSYRDAEIQNDWMLEVLEVREEIIHLDEVLTNSARMAAETGDNKWEQRYREYEPKLGATISRAIELVPALLQTEGAATTDAANVALVEMEE